MGQKWKRLVGWGTEITWGAAVPVSKWFTAHGDVSLGVNPRYERSQESRQTRQPHNHLRVGWEANGDIPDIEVRDGEFDDWWKYALGENPSGGVYRVKDGGIPSVTLEENKNGKTGWRWYGCKVQSMSLEASPGNILQANISLVAKKGLEIGLASLAAPSFSATDPYVFHQGTFKIDAAEATIFDFKCEIANNLKYPRWASGSKYSLEPTEAMAEVTGTFQIDHADADNWNKIQGATRAALNYVFTDGTNTLTIDFPRVVFNEPLGWSFDDAEVMEEVGWTAERKPDGTNEMTVTIT